eukprot:TRINITY_DN9658_c0_g2_i2.p1 TRINITY_DN9658_c0_g2~~TRINITY_DN9658_c0_g2_i2.p1  ORF type:complete len:658 (+),score=110.17 TRINITY_DN9658_c0_g2_i2:103-1974(+)
MVHSHRKRRKAMRAAAAELAEAAAAAVAPAAAEPDAAPAPAPAPEPALWGTTPSGGYQATKCAWRYGPHRNWRSRQGCRVAISRAGSCVATSAEGTQLLQAVGRCGVAYGHRPQCSVMIGPRCADGCAGADGVHMFVKLPTPAEYDAACSALQLIGSSVEELSYTEFWRKQASLAFPDGPATAAAVEAAAAAAVGEADTAAAPASAAARASQPAAGGRAAGPAPAAAAATSGDPEEAAGEAQLRGRHCRQPRPPQGSPAAPARAGGEDIARLAAELATLQRATKELDTRMQQIAAKQQSEPTASEPLERTYAVLHEDGDFDAAVPASLIRLCPTRPDSWGKQETRGHDLLPPGAGPPGEGLYIGAPVVARWAPYQRTRAKGTDKDAWFAGTIVSVPAARERQRLRRPRVPTLGDVPVRAPCQPPAAAPAAAYSPYSPPLIPIPAPTVPQTSSTPVEPPALLPPQYPCGSCEHSPTSGWSADHPFALAPQMQISAPAPAEPPVSGMSGSTDSTDGMHTAVEAVFAVLHEDGDVDEDVPASRIRLCPGRPDDWGKGDRRGSDVLPPGAEQPGRGLALGSAVVARYSRYQGRSSDPWFAGTIIGTPQERWVPRTRRVELAHAAAVD